MAGCAELKRTRVAEGAASLADELLVQDITEPSAVLRSLADDELQAAYDNVLEQFALELLIGARETPTGPTGKLVMTPTTAPSISCKQPSTLWGLKSEGGSWDAALRVQTPTITPHGYAGAQLTGTRLSLLAPRGYSV